MNLLVDECVHQGITRRLRSMGHEVKDINEAMLKGTKDAEVLELAKKEGRILITVNGKDFRNLSYETSTGVIWLKINPPSPDSVMPQLEKLFKKLPNQEQYHGKLCEVKASEMILHERL